VLNENYLIPGHVRPARKSRTREVIKGTYEIELYLGRDENGKRLRKKFRFTGRRKDADAELLRLRKLYSGIPNIATGEITFAEYLRDWLQAIRPDSSGYSLRQSTWESYVAIVENHLIPYLGEIKLNKLDPRHIATYKEKKLSPGGRLDTGYSKGLSPDTLNKHLTTLNQALEDAASLEKQLISYNPMRLVERAGRRGRKASPQFKGTYLLPGELTYILSHIEHYDIYPIIFTTAHTGMRISEVLGLRLCDVNLKRKEIEQNG